MVKHTQTLLTADQCEMCCLIHTHWSMITLIVLYPHWGWNSVPEYIITCLHTRPQRYVQHVSPQCHKLFRVIRGRGMQRSPTRVISVSLLTIQPPPLQWPMKCVSGRGWVRFGLDIQTLTASGSWYLMAFDPINYINTTFTTRSCSSCWVMLGNSAACHPPSSPIFPGWLFTIDRLCLKPLRRPANSNKPVILK